MGCCTSTVSDAKLKYQDFTKVTIPKEYELIKIATFNVNLRNTINLSNKIREIISYIDTANKNKPIDVICIQGVHDYNSSQELIKEIKFYAENNRKTYYFAPDFDVMGDTDLSQVVGSSIRNLSQRTQTSNPRDRTTIQNMIISTFPIVSFVYAEIDDALDLDDILGAQAMVGANISIYGNIISVYNTALSRDIKSANLINRDIREKELDTIFRTIDENILSLQTESFNHYFKTDVHFLVGSMNISEFNNGIMNEEFCNLLQRYHSRKRLEKTFK